MDFAGGLHLCSKRFETARGSLMILDFVPIIIFEERVFAQPLGAIARTLGLPEHGFDAPFDRLIVPDVRHDSDFVTLAIDEGARDLVALVQNPDRKSTRLN